MFATYAELFKLLGDQPFAAPALRQLQRDLAADGVRADQQMARLGRLMALADLRGWMFFYPIQLATLWNVHVLWLLERWQRAAGAQRARLAGGAGRVRGAGRAGDAGARQPELGLP